MVGLEMAEGKVTEVKLEDFFTKMLSVIGKTTVDQVADLLKKNRVTIAVAESLTGGLISEKLTTTPGSSDYFAGGIVCYTNRSKVMDVGVPAKLIADHGAVSKEVAVAMAEGVQKKMRADLGLSATGVAGPGTGGEVAPIGLTYIALADNLATEWKELHLSGTREEIREKASAAALGLVWLHLGGAGIS